MRPRSPVPTTPTRPVLPALVLVSTLLAGALLAGGCGSLRVAPPDTPANAGDALAGAVELPDSWTAGPAAAAAPGAPAAPAVDGAAAGEAAHTAPWWESFGDPTLSGLIEESLAGSFDLAAAAARVDAARARARIAGADLLPQADLSLSGARNRRNFIGFPIPGAGGSVLSTTNTSWGVSLDLSWELDLWGRIRAGREAADRTLGATRADLAGAALSLSGQTAKAYFAVLEARQQVALAEATLDNRRTNAERVRRRYEAGLAGALDLRLARAESASAESVLGARRQVLDALERQLETLVVRYPGRRLDALPDRLPDRLVEGLAPDTEGGLVPVPAGLPSEIVARRPDLSAAEARLEAAGFQVAQARAALYPGLRLTGSTGRSSEDVEDLLNGDFSVWSIAGGLLQPLFQGGRLRANVDLQRASFAEATAVYAAQVLRALGEVETALASEGLLADRQAALAEAAREARRAQELAEERYRSGLVSFVDLLEAQRRSVDAESGLIQVARQRLDARVDLVLALGGGFTAADAKRPAATDAVDRPAERSATDSDRISEPSSD